jgi:glycosyltransferase involved in cell wall biosynthesis
MEAVVSGMAMIQADMADVILAGGVEHMSGVSYSVPNARWGCRLQDQVFVDNLIRGLYCSSHLLPGPEKGPLKEGMPLALLEAMSCGKAVVGSDISGINDIITHMENGLLVPPRDPEAIANAILTLLADKKLRTRLGQNARQRMVNRYSWNLISDKIEKVYAEASGNLALL